MKKRKKKKPEALPEPRSMTLTGIHATGGQLRELDMAGFFRSTNDEAVFTVSAEDGGTALYLTLSDDEVAQWCRVMNDRLEESRRKRELQ